jgi:hypothetical protein
LLNYRPIQGAILLLLGVQVVTLTLLLVELVVLTKQELSQVMVELVNRDSFNRNSLGNQVSLVDLVRI